MKSGKFNIDLGKFLLIFCALVLTGPAWNLDEAEGKTIIRLAHHAPVKGYQHQWTVDFKEYVERETKGEIEVQIFPAKQLGNERENVNSVNMGSVDMTFAGHAFLDQWYPAGAIVTLPLLYDDYAHAGRSFGRNGKAGMLLTEQTLKRSNIRNLGYTSSGFRCMYFREKAVTKVEHFKGLKMRSGPSEVYVNMYRALGAVPTPISWGEAYTVLQTGVVDGTGASLLGFYQYRMYEVCKHLTLTNHMMTVMGGMINKKFYANLSPQFQKIISEAGWVASEKLSKGAEKMNEEALAGLKKEGMQVHEISRESMRKALQPMIDAFVKKIKAEELYKLVDAERRK